MSTTSKSCCWLKSYRSGACWCVIFCSLSFDVVLIQGQLDDEKKEKLETLEEMYLESIGQVGQAHRDAAMEGSKPDARSFQKWENENKALQRYRKALVKLHDDIAEQEQRDKQHIFTRYFLANCSI